MSALRWAFGCGILVAWFASPLPADELGPKELVIRGDVFYGNHQYDRARADYNAAVKAAPKWSVALRQRGKLLVRYAKDLPAARRDLERAVELDPKDATAHMHLAYTLGRLGEIDAMQAIYRKAVSLTEDVGPIYFDWIQLAFDSQKWKETIEAADGLIQLDRTELTKASKSDESPSQMTDLRLFAARKNRGMSLLALGRFEEAEADLTIAEEYAKSLPQVILRSWAYMDKRETLRGELREFKLKHVPRLPALDELDFADELIATAGNDEPARKVALARANQALGARVATTDEYFARGRLRETLLQMDWTRELIGERMAQEQMAIDDYLAVLRLGGRNREAHERLGRIYGKTNRPIELRLENVERWLTTFGDDEKQSQDERSQKTWLLRSAAEYAMAAKQYEKALAYWDRHLAASPLEAIVGRLKRADTIVLLRGPEAGLAEYRAIAKERPRDDHVREKIVGLLLQLKRRDEALREYKKIAVSDSNRSATFKRLYGLLIKAATERNDDEAVIGYLQDWAKSDEKSREAKLQLAAAFRERGRFEEAIEQYRASIQGFVTNFERDQTWQTINEVRREMAIKHRAAGEVDQAVSVYQEIARHALHGSGRAEAAAAIEAIRVLAQSPRDAKERVAHAIAHRQLGEPDQASALLDQVVREAPTSGVALCHRAMVRLEAGEFDSARADIDRAEQLQPKLAHVAAARGAILAASGDLENAATAYRKALEMNPYLSDVRGRLALIRLDQGAADDELIAELERMAVTLPGVRFAMPKRLAKTSAAASSPNPRTTGRMAQGGAMDGIQALEQVMHLRNDNPRNVGRPESPEAAERRGDANRHDYKTLGIAWFALGRMDEAKACWSEHKEQAFLDLAEARLQGKIGYRRLDDSRLPRIETDADAWKRMLSPQLADRLAQPVAAEDLYIDGLVHSDPAKLKAALTAKLLSDDPLYGDREALNTAIGQRMGGTTIAEIRRMIRSGKEPEKALALLESAVASGPGLQREKQQLQSELAVAFAEQAEALLASKQLDAARKAAYLGRKLDPTSPRLFACLARIDGQKGYLVQSAMFYDRAIESIQARLAAQFAPGETHMSRAHLREELAILYFERAQTVWRMSDNLGAVDDFTEFLKLQPRHPGALSQRGANFLYLGKKDQAEADFALAVQIQPTQKTYIESVRKAVGDNVHPDPVRAAAERYRTTSFQRQVNGDLPGALADIRRAHALRPDDVDILLRFANFHEAAEQYGHAALRLNMAVDLAEEQLRANKDPAMTDALKRTLVRLLWQRTQLAFIKLYDMEGAAADTSRMLELSPENSKAQTIHPGAMAAMGQLETARAKINVLVEQGALTREKADSIMASAAKIPRIDTAPKAAERHLATGKAWLDEANLKTALAEFDLAVRRQPDMVEARIARAGAHLALKQFEPATADLQHAAGLQPKHPRLQSMIGESLYHQRRFDESAAALDRAIDADPNNARALALRGLCRWAAGGGDEQALTEMRRAISNDGSLNNWIVDEASALRPDGQLIGIYRDAPHVAALWVAAKAGDAQAALQLGHLFRDGRGVPVHQVFAYLYYRMAADAGLPEGQFQVGESYLSGFGVDRSERLAIEWFEMAASAGYDPAIKRLQQAKQAGDRRPRPQRVER